MCNFISSTSIVLILHQIGGDNLWGCNVVVVDEVGEAGKKPGTCFKNPLAFSILLFKNSLSSPLLTSNFPSNPDKVMTARTAEISPP
jgi:hypothetical protein